MSLMFLVMIVRLRLRVRLITECSSCVLWVLLRLSRMKMWLTPSLAVGRRPRHRNEEQLWLKLLSVTLTFLLCSSLRVPVSRLGLLTIVALAILSMSWLGGMF